MTLGMTRISGMGFALASLLALASAGASGGPVPIMPGQQQVSVSVSAVYEIGP